jgi:DNA-binding protein WhiA
MISYGLNAKIVKRRNDFVIYLKDIEEISDFLRIIGATKTVFDIDNLVIKREYSANIQRQMNAEIANEMKTLSAAKKQIKYIHTIEYNYPLEKLDPKILLVMKVRLENAEASFNELIEILNNKYGEKITKSGLNHRFIKIKELAEQIDGSDK